MRGGQASLVGVLGKEGHEHFRVGGPPSGDGVPAGPGLVASDRVAVEDDGVVAGDDVVERLVVQRAAGDPVDGRVDGAERVAGLLVGQDEGLPGDPKADIPPEQVVTVLRGAAATFFPLLAPTSAR